MVGIGGAGDVECWMLALFVFFFSLLSFLALFYHKGPFVASAAWRLRCRQPYVLWLPGCMHNGAGSWRPHFALAWRWVAGLRIRLTGFITWVDSY